MSKLPPTLPCNIRVEVEPDEPLGWYRSKDMVEWRRERAAELLREAEKLVEQIRRHVDVGKRNVRVMYDHACPWCESPNGYEPDPKTGEPQCCDRAVEAFRQLQVEDGDGD